MSKSIAIKIGPKSPVKIMDLKMKSEDLYVVKGIDADGDIYPLVEISIYNNESKNCITSSDDINAFDRFRKTSKANKVYIDSVVVNEWFRGHGLGSKAMGELEELLSVKGFDMICLKAHPIIKWSVCSYSKSKKAIKDERSKIHSFYKKNGYEEARIGGDFFFKKII